MISALVLSMVVGGALAGVVLLVVGLRGRRINDHPICRGCGFDLVGLYPGAARCPECGSTLDSTKAVRIGARRTWKRMLLVAVPMLLVGLGGGGTLIWASATSYNWYPVAPAWVLEAVAGLDDPGRQGKAVGELATRLTAGTLDDERADRLIERGLEVQADRALTWVPVWGDLIEAGLAADRLSREQFEAYVDHAIRCELVIRKRVRAGESTQISLWIVPDRMGPAAFLRGSQSWPRLVVDASVIRPADTGSGSRFMLRGSGLWSSSRQVEIVLEPGQHTLAGRPMMEIGVTGFATQVALDPVVITRELSVEFEVVPTGTALVELIDDPSLAPAMADSILIPELRVVAEGEGFTSIDAQVRGADLPMDFAFDVLIRGIDGELYHWTRMCLSAGTQQTMGSGGKIEARLGETADVILRASEEALLMRADLDSAWGGEIVIEDVPVVRPESVGE